MRWSALVALLAMSACGASRPGGYFAERRPGRCLRPMWSRVITEPRVELLGALEAVEFASPLVDIDNGQVAIGTQSGWFVGLTLAGRPLFRYRTGAAIRGGVAADLSVGEIVVAADDGVLHNIHPAGRVRWTLGVDGAVSSPIAIQDDLIFLVTDSDVVLAVDRTQGTIVWRYEAPVVDGFSSSGHAGVFADDSRHVFAAFTNGIVASLDAERGEAWWTRDTTEEVVGDASPVQMLDIDTTPVMARGTLYVASFAAGLFALEPTTGSVQWVRSDLTGIVKIVPTLDGFLVASADRGIMSLSPEGDVRWTRAPLRGSFTDVEIADEVVLATESRGGIVALHPRTGDEIDRVEAGGFTGGVTYSEGVASAFSNHGRLFVWRNACRSSN